MPREFDSQDDYGEPHEISLPQPRFPTTVKIAGIVWIVLGSLSILSAVVSLRLPAKSGRDVGVALDTGAALAGLSAWFGIAFVSVGIQSIRGTSRDTLGNSAGSIVLGIFPLLFGIVAVGGTVFPVGKNQAAPALVVMAFAMGLGLIGAGILALLGRTEYKRWRRWQKERENKSRVGELRFPVAVRIAGIVQIGLGALSLVFVLVLAIVLFMNPNSTGASSFLLVLFGAPASAAIAYFGNLTKVGEIRDILHIGMFLVVGGVLFAPLGLMGMVIGIGLLAPLDADVMLLLFVIGSVTIAVISIAFIRLGRAVLHARKGYQSWKQCHECRAFGID